MNQMDKIVLEVAKGLVKCFKKENFIVFPEYHNISQDGEQRISEQESKVLFTNEFMNNKIRFAVEVPTISKHCFKSTQLKKNERSARFDMVTYKDNTYDFDWVIELKSGNPPQFNFQKDFEKMAKSNSNCLWFHTLKNADSGTYKSLDEKINESIKNVIKDFGGNFIWKFVVVVLEQAELYSVNIPLKKDESNKFSISSLSPQKIA